MALLMLITLLSLTVFALANYKEENETNEEIAGFLDVAEVSDGIDKIEAKDFIIEVDYGELRIVDFKEDLVTILEIEKPQGFSYNRGTMIKAEGSNLVYRQGNFAAIIDVDGESQVYYKDGGYNVLIPSKFVSTTPFNSLKTKYKSMRENSYISTNIKIVEINKEDMTIRDTETDIVYDIPKEVRDLIEDMTRIEKICLSTKINQLAYKNTDYSLVIPISRGYSIGIVSSKIVDVFSNISETYVLRKNGSVTDYQGEVFLK